MELSGIERNLEESKGIGIVLDRFLQREYPLGLKLISFKRSVVGYMHRIISKIIY